MKFPHFSPKIPIFFYQGGKATVQAAANITSDKIHGFSPAPRSFPLPAAFLRFWLPLEFWQEAQAHSETELSRSQRGPGMTGKCWWIYWIIKEPGHVGKRERGGGVGDSMGGRIPCAAGITRGRNRKGALSRLQRLQKDPEFSSGFFFSSKEKVLTCSFTSVRNVFPLGLGGFVAFLCFFGASLWSLHGMYLV